MENTEKKNLSDWVDERLAQLPQQEEWQPDAARALRRFRQARRTQNARVLQTVAAIAACVLPAALPKSRRMIQRLWTGSHVVNIGQVSADVRALKDGQIAPDFALKNAQGAGLRLSTYRGKVVLLNFWGNLVPRMHD
jgi:hypothetical protein